MSAVQALAYFWLSFTSPTIGTTQPPVQPDIAPPPRLASFPVAVEAIPGGYNILLNRWASELLRDALAATGDEKELAAKIRAEAKKRRMGNEDDETAAKLELVAFLVSSQLPGFKKELADKLGPNGVTIRVTGLQAPIVKFRKPRPVLENAASALRAAMPLLPDEAREVVEALRAVARTTPLMWKVEPR